MKLWLDKQTVGARGEESHRATEEWEGGLLPFVLLVNPKTRKVPKQTNKSPRPSGTGLSSELLEGLREEDCEFKVNLGNFVRPDLKILK